MTNYYYTRNPEVKHNEKTWNFTLYEHNFIFSTDNGVFSKATVDYGSRVLLAALQDSQINGDILDVGCGYGPLGLALAYKFKDVHVDMVDVNLLALQLAKKNAIQNGLNNVTIFESDGYQAVTKNDYAAIITNPPIRAGKEVVHNILSQAKQHLAPEGTLTAVIQKKQGAPSAQKKMLEVFGNCEVIAKDKGYFILQSTKQLEE